MNTCKCKYDEKLNKPVHVFEEGSRTCQCGKITVPEPRVKSKGPNGLTYKPFADLRNVGLGVGIHLDE